MPSAIVPGELAATESEKMSTTAAVELVRHSKIGTELTEEQSQVLARLVEFNEYADGDVVVEEGASDDKLRVVLAGALAVAKRDDDDWVRLNVLTAGDLAGELAFLDSRPRYAALVALGPTKVFSLERAKLESLLDSHPLIVYRVMRGITRFAHQVLHRTGAQMSELTAYIYKSKAKY
jgi:CRP-like cAMP-binding protein